MHNFPTRNVHDAEIAMLMLSLAFCNFRLARPPLS
jgi:hypothetical protein